MDYISYLILALFSSSYLIATNNGEIILRVDPLALLSTTLRTYQKVACDTDQVVIACPRGTSISIEFAQYNKFIAKDGISIDELCPEHNISKIRAKSKHLLRGSTFGSPNQKVPANRYVNGVYSLVKPNADSTTLLKVNQDMSNISRNANISAFESDPKDEEASENCMWPNALQYSLLQTVVEACQKKKHCKFNGMPHYYGPGASGVGDASGSSSYHSTTASSTQVTMDPCPKRRKIVEVAYKCRPYEFRSKVACHNDVAQLECNPYSRIAVYSASFGRTAYESIQCPQPQGVREETCLASYATETVMQICHGRRRCNIAADANTFGSPCQPNSRMYLKVVYTCVPKQVLQDKYGNEIETDETDDFEGDMNILYDEEVIYKESEAIPKLISNSTTGVTKNIIPSQIDNGNGTINGSLGNEIDTNGINPVMTHSADLSLEDDQERLYLYLLIAGSVGVLLCGAIVTVRVVKQTRHNSTTDTHSMSSIKASSAVNNATSTETAIPNGFNDTISEIDTDIDLTSHMPLPSVSKNENYVTYDSSSNIYGTLGRSQNSGLLMGGNVQNNGSPSLITNPLICGSRQSPDLIGLSSNTLIAANNLDSAPTQISNIFAPAILIGGSGTSIVSSSGIPTGSSAISTVVPITSLAQYTTAPTIRSGYLINSDAILSQPPNVISPSTNNITNSSNDAFNAQSFQQSPILKQQQMPQYGTPISHQLLTSTLRRTKSTANPPILQHQLSYDGTSPRTHPTGVPINSQFYYG